jgi:hypothetical protein
MITQGRETNNLRIQNPVIKMKSKRWGFEKERTEASVSPPEVLPFFGVVLTPAWRAFESPMAMA